MIAYTAGIIAGASTTVFPLIYMMNYDRCIAMIQSQNPDFDPADFTHAISHMTPNLLAGIAVVGAVVMLICTLMAAITGLRKLNRESAITTDGKKTLQKAPAQKRSKRSMDTEGETEI